MRPWRGLQLVFLQLILEIILQALNTLQDGLFDIEKVSSILLISHLAAWKRFVFLSLKLGISPNFFEVICVFLDDRLAVFGRSICSIPASCLTSFWSPGHQVIELFHIGCRRFRAKRASGTGCASNPQSIDFSRIYHPIKLQPSHALLVDWQDGRDHNEIIIVTLTNQRETCRSDSMVEPMLGSPSKAFADADSKAEALPSILLEIARRALADAARGLF